MNCLFPGESMDNDAMIMIMDYKDYQVTINMLTVSTLPNFVEN